VTTLQWITDMPLARPLSVEGYDDLSFKNLYDDDNVGRTEPSLDSSCDEVDDT
jgi:hypothetical protein